VPAPKAAPLDPDLCVANGPGLESAKQGQQAQFTIQTRDAEGNNMRSGGHRMEVSVQGKTGKVQSAVKDKNDGTYLATYMPTQPGPVEIAVSADSQPIWRSPWKVDVLTAEVDAPSSSASGEGLSRSQLGRDASFVVATFGKNGVPIALPKHGLELEVKIDPAVRNTKDSAVPTVRELGDAKYEIKYAPVQAGKHMISVAIQGVPIHDSPFRMVADPGQPFGPKSSAVGDGLHDATEGQEAFFTVKATDQAGNPLTAGGYQVQARLAGQGTKTNCKVKDMKDGTTAVKYLAPPAGPYHLDVVLNNKPISGSPFAVTVHPVGIDPLKCKASGPGLESAVDGMPAYFHVFINNKLGAPISVGKRMDINLTSSMGLLQKTCDELETGKYLVKYQPSCSGEIAVDIRVDGVHIPGSTFRVIVKKGPLELLYEMIPVLGVEVTNESTDHQGLKVLGIQIDGPVNRAGIIRDEHLSIVDGIPLNSSADLEAYKKETTPGDILDFRVISLSGAQRNVSVVVGAKDISPEDVAQLRSTAGVSERKWNRRAFAATKPHLARR
jgi:filamin